MESSVFSGQFSGSVPQVSNLKTRIPDRESPIANLRSRISDLKSRISDLKSRISDLKSRNSDLKSRTPDLISQIPAFACRCTPYALSIRNSISRCDRMAEGSLWRAPQGIRCKAQPLRLAAFVPESPARAGSCPPGPERQPPHRVVPVACRSRRSVGVQR